MGIPFLATNAAGAPIPGVAANSGRSINLIDGINGIAAGGVAAVNIGTDRRLHMSKFQTAAVNYTGGTLLATKHLTGGGNDALVVTLAVSAFQVPTGVTVTTAGNGYNVGDTFTVVDATGTGAIFTVATLTGGAGSGVATATYNAGSATASAIDPALLLSIVKENVGSIAIRDIPALYTGMISQLNGYNPQLGDLDLYYTEPWLNELRGNEATSWDLVGQTTMTYQLFINPGYLLPSITGIQEFDRRRNVVKLPGGGYAPNLEPITRHLFTTPIGTGLTPITTIPIGYRIRRLYLLGSSPGNLTALEVLADGNKVLEGNVSTLNNRYQDQGFQFGKANFQNQNQTAAKPLGLNKLNYFDTACLFDLDGRYRKGLACASTLSLRVTSSAAQQLNIIIEALPGTYA